MEITNRVAESDIALYNLEALWDGRPILELDLEPFLMEGLVLRERAFREGLKAHDWAQYQDGHVAVFCSTDAIIPTWAWMLVTTKLDGIAASVDFGREKDLLRAYFVRALEAEDWSAYSGKPVVVKGCGSSVVPTDAYLIATRKLQAVASKLMYGEPCSSVPLWRKKTEAAAPPSGAVKPAKPVGIRPAGPPRTA